MFEEFLRKHVKEISRKNPNDVLKKHVKEMASPIFFKQTLLDN
jgi:hypothetical protein